VFGHVVQVRVTIIQAQQLAGLDIDPVVRVDVGPDSRYTSISKSTNCPYYNEFYVFDFHEPTAIILDKMLTISVSRYHLSVSLCSLYACIMIGLINTAVTA